MKEKQKKYDEGDINYEILSQETIENIERGCGMKIFEDTNGNYLITSLYAV